MISSNLGTAVNHAENEDGDGRRQLLPARAFDVDALFNARLNHFLRGNAQIRCVHSQADNDNKQRWQNTACMR